MAKDEILWPMGALALLTFLVLGMIPIRRLAAVWRKELTSEDFRYGESDRVNGHVSLPNRALMNLLEVPLLFYVICILSYMTDTAGTTQLASAWLYVGLRLAHTAIQMSYNEASHRIIPFAASNFVLVAMWVNFFFRLAAQ